MPLKLKVYYATFFVISLLVTLVGLDNVYNGQGEIYYFIAGKEFPLPRGYPAGVFMLMGGICLIVTAVVGFLVDRTSDRQK